jgi:hypothetical protein
VEVVEVLAVQVATLHQQLLEMVEQDHLHQLLDFPHTMLVVEVVEEMPQ